MGDYVNTMNRIKDKTGKMGMGMIGWIVGILVVAVVFSALWSTIQRGFSDAANNTTNSGGQELLRIAPLLIIVALVLAIVFGIAMKGKK